MGAVTTSYEVGSSAGPVASGAKSTIGYGFSNSGESVASGALQSVRLGRRERNVLLYLAKGGRGWSGECGSDECETDSWHGLSRDEMNRRAESRRVASLRAEKRTEALGFVRSEGGERHRWSIHGSHSDHRRLVLTDLGRLVIDTFRRELETGKRIRWSRLPSQESAA